MTRLIVTAHADRDFDAILGYLTEHTGPTTAQTYTGRFADTLERLTQFPGSGSPHPALGENTRIATYYRASSSQTITIGHHLLVARGA